MDDNTKQTYISSSLWDDPWFMMELSNEERLFYLYLITNSRRSIAGVYQTTLVVMTRESGFSPDQVKAMLARFEADEKVYYRHGYIIVKTGAKHQKWWRRPTIKQGINKLLGALSPEMQQTLRDVGYEYPLDEVFGPSESPAEPEESPHTIEVGQGYPTPTLPIGQGEDSSILPNDLDLDLDSDLDRTDRPRAGSKESPEPLNEVVRSVGLSLSEEEAAKAAHTQALADPELGPPFVEWLCAYARGAPTIRNPARFVRSALLGTLESMSELVARWQEERPQPKPKPYVPPDRCDMCGCEKIRIAGNEAQCVECHAWGLLDRESGTWSWTNDDAEPVALAVGGGG